MKYPNMTWGTMEAIVNKLGGEEAAKSFLRRPFEVAGTKNLDYIGTTFIPATTEKFVAKGKFSKVTIFYGTWDNFTKSFLVGDGKTEEPLEGRALHYGNIIKSSHHGLIIEELGGETKAETTLTDLYELLKKQSKGEEGVLLNNGYVNIFYIRTADGDLRAVYVYWDDCDWVVTAASIKHTRIWSLGCRVFSKKF